MRFHAGVAPGRLAALLDVIGCSFMALRIDATLRECQRGAHAGNTAEHDAQTKGRRAVVLDHV